MNLHHIGIVTNNIETSKILFLNIMCLTEETKVIYDDKLGVKVQFLTDLNGNRYELVEPLSDTSPVAKFAKNMRNNLHHLAYTVSDFDNALFTLRKQGLVPTNQPTPAVAFGGKRVVFFVNSNQVLIEVIEDYK